MSDQKLDPRVEVTNYGQHFSELIGANVETLVRSGQVRKRNLGAPYLIGENHIREYISGRIKSGTYEPPTHWPRLIVERKVLNDVPGYGGVDYFFLRSSASRTPDLRDVLATCEVGGPTRRALLRGSKKNWYPKIVRDIRKQAQRAVKAPDAQYYLALVIVPAPDLEVHQALGQVFTSMLQEVPQAKLLECSCTELDGLYIVVMRVQASDPSAAQPPRAEVPPATETALPTGTDTVH